MPLSYVAVLLLVLLAAVGHRRPVAQQITIPEQRSPASGLVLIAAVLVVLIAAFTVMLLITLCAVTALACLRS